MPPGIVPTGPENWAYIYKPSRTAPMSYNYQKTLDQKTYNFHSFILKTDAFTYRRNKKSNLKTTSPFSTFAFKLSCTCYMSPYRSDIPHRIERRPTSNHRKGPSTTPNRTIRPRPALESNQGAAIFNSNPRDHMANSIRGFGKNVLAE